MSFAGLLIQRAEVYRRPGSSDRFGQPDGANPSLTNPGNPHSTFPCRIDRGSGGRVAEERSRDVFEVTYDLFCAADADVNEDDAVRVLDEDGEVLIPMAKVKVKNSVGGALGTHHLELKLSVQRGPQ